MAVDTPYKFQSQCSVALHGNTLADHYGACLLHSLGIATDAIDEALRDTADFELDAAKDWAEAGLMWLTGDPSGPPVRASHAIASCARGAMNALRAVAGTEFAHSLDGAALLGERSQLLGFSRRGRVSVNGSCHLLRACDGTIALNLAREEDWRLLPAWLETEVLISQWDTLADVIAGRKVSPLLARGRLLGLPVAGCPSSRARPETVPPWYRLCGDGRTTAVPPVARSPLVVDLSALWAGPLCSHLLLGAGARVIKVESTRRPDGARKACAEFFDLLNANKDSVILDLHSDAGQRQLRALLSVADIVIESSRPRALQQLGIDAQSWVDHCPGLIWISITGYGRREPQANWVAFGDDAAIAAGVMADVSASGAEPVFCGDAICDPLTGMHAALAAMAFWHCGQGGLLDINLCDVAAHCKGFYETKNPGVVSRKEQDKHWQLALDDHHFDVQTPRARLATRRAAALGADTRRVLQEYHIR